MHTQVIVKYLKCLCIMDGSKHSTENYLFDEIFYIVYANVYVNITIFVTNY